MRFSLLRRGQQLVQATHPRMPAFFDLGQQDVGAAYGVGIAGHTLRATVLLFGDQLGAFQNGDVLLYSCKRHLVPRGQLADRRVCAHHPSQNVAPCGIG
jgi:hypothetical protein